MPKTDPDPGLSWARQILDIQKEQAHDEPDDEPEEPDTVKTTNCVFYSMIFAVLTFLAIALIVWFVLRNLP